MTTAPRWPCGQPVGNTGNPVPVFAYGPGSELFAGLQDITEIPKKFAGLLGVDRFPVPLEATSTWDKLAGTIPPKSEPEAVSGAPAPAAAAPAAPAGTAPTTTVETAAPQAVAAGSVQ